MLQNFGGPTHVNANGVLCPQVRKVPPIYPENKQCNSNMSDSVMLRDVRGLVHSIGSGEFERCRR